MKFIQKFKGFQFISGGVVTAVLGAVKYFICISAPSTSIVTTGASPLDIKTHTCDTNGPGQGENFGFQLATFTANILLVWFAFFFLPCSKKLGVVKFKHSLRTKDNNTANDQSGEVEVKGGKRKKLSSARAGGRLRSLLYYDFFCAIVCVGLLFVLNETTSVDDVTAVNSTTEVKFWDNWQIRANMFWMQVLYSLLSFPFVVFQIPVVFSILTHAKPTGYSPNGLCVRTKLSEEYYK